jgi:hypothetical protein
MNLVELDRALQQLRLSGMATVLDTRLRQAPSEQMTPIDLVSALVADELQRRQDRLLDQSAGAPFQGSPGKCTINCDETMGASASGSHL